jgi:hypothetical protein
MLFDTMQQSSFSRAATAADFLDQRQANLVEAWGNLTFPTLGYVTQTTDLSTAPELWRSHRISHRLEPSGAWELYP